MRQGKEINELWLSQRLRPYSIRPKTMWIGGQAAKGYLREDFDEVFTRYLPKSEIESWLTEATSKLTAPETSNQPTTPTTTSSQSNS